MATFTDDFTKLREDSDQAHKDRQEFYDKMRGEVEQLAVETRNQLTTFRAELTEMSNHLRDSLKQCATDLKTGGDIFRGTSHR